MLTEVLLFLSCFGLGTLSRFCYKGLMRAETKIGRAASITLEFISMSLLTAAFIAIMLFLGSGIFMPFTLIAIITGFVATSIFF